VPKVIWRVWNNFYEALLKVLLDNFQYKATLTVGS
jgi:hypothetical protein